MAYFYRRRVILLYIYLYQIWAKLPIDMKTSVSLRDFKRHLKSNNVNIATVDGGFVKLLHIRDSIKHRGPLIWNLLKMEVRSCGNKGLFSGKLKGCKID